MKNLETNLVTLLKEFISENEIEVKSKINNNSRLFGSSSIFDSMELVQFIVEVEQFLDDEYGVEIELTSEKAMSRRTSPFISIKLLVNFINEETNE